MRSSFLLLLFVIGLFLKSHAIIGIGYSYKNVLFWRFFEMKDGKPVPEILVYNTGYVAVTFTLRKTFVVDMMIDSSKQEWYENESARCARDTIIKTAVIPPASYEVFVISNGATDYKWDGAFINGKYAGIAAHQMREPDKTILDKYKYKYYSYEGLYATPFFGLIGKNKLYTRRGETDNLFLFFNFEDKEHYPFFSGINDMSAEIIKGVDRAYINFRHDAYALDERNKRARFPVNMGTKESYTMDISVKVAENEEFPDINMHTYFQNGNSGIGLPVFVQ